MTQLLDYPFLVAAMSFAAMALAAYVGGWVSRRRAIETDARGDFEVIEAATLTLLGLIIAFSFSMALNRYDQRKNYEEEEANAIGTAWVRLDLLPADDAAKLRPLLADYLDQRIAFYTHHDPSHLAPINERIAHLQNEMWSALRRPALAQPTQITALVVQSMNDVLNTQGYTQAAWWNRIPLQAWNLMAALSLCANLLVGLSARPTRAKPGLLLVLPFVVAIAILLIADIDSPRGGFIHVNAQNLEALAQSVRPRGGS
jgi:hypothetical protein